MEIIFLRFLFGHFVPDFCIKSHLITAEIKQNFEIKTVAVPRYHETVSLIVQNAIVNNTFEEFSFFSVFLSPVLSKRVLKCTLLRPK